MPDALPVVAVLATGGTIAGAQADATSAGYKAGSFSVDDLLAAVPQLAGIARIRAEQVANVGSQNMTHDVWRALAARVDALCQDASVAGIVITHGTDTLEETAYFLSLVVRHDKPVVLVGDATGHRAGRRRSRQSVNAVALARRGPRPRAAGGDERGHPLRARGAEDRQRRPVRVQLAQSRPCRCHARRCAEVLFAQCHHAFHAKRVFTALLEKSGWPRVGIVYAHADLQADVIDFMASVCQGIVLAGVGDGNATDAAIAALTRAAAAGVAVARSSRTGSGLVARDVELDDAALGFIAAADLNPQKARILLMLGLSATRDPAALQHCFERY